MLGQKVAIVAFGLTACLSVAAGTAHAGPCTQQIADVAKELSRTASLGPATTGALSGSAPGSIAKNAPAPKAPPAPSAGQAEKSGGAGATQEINNATAQIATSPQDVRLQQKGQPTVAQGGNAAAAEPMAKAKSELEKARRLDQSNDGGCQAPLQEAQRLMKQG